MLSWKVIMEDFNSHKIIYYDLFKSGYWEKIAKELKEVVPTVEFVDTIQSEEEKKKFIVIFRELTKILIKLRIFREFKFTEDEVLLSNQEYLDYKSKYLDTVIPKGPERKVTILDDIESFMHELGNSFCFIGSEYKIKISDNYHKIDLLLFNIKYDVVSISNVYTVLSFNLSFLFPTSSTSCP